MVSTDVSAQFYRDIHAIEYPSSAYTPLAGIKILLLTPSESFSRRIHDLCYTSLPLFHGDRTSHDVLNVAQFRPETICWYRPDKAM